MRQQKSTEKKNSSELLNPHNRNKALLTTEGESVPFKGTITLHKAEKESQTLTGRKSDYSLKGTDGPLAMNSPGPFLSTKPQVPTFH